MTIETATEPTTDAEELKPWRLDPALHAWRTDPRVVQKAIDLIPGDFRPRTILDAAAGEGVWGLHAKARWPTAHLLGVELQNCTPAEGFDCWVRDDLRTWVAPHKFDLIVTNPPFGDLGWPIILRCLNEWLADDGCLLVYYHQRILASIDRYAYYRHHAPVSAHTVVPRPSHTDDPKTEKQGEYIVLRWQQGVHGYQDSGQYLGGWIYWKEKLLPDESQATLPLFAIAS
jgi:hypothetical protein